MANTPIQIKRTSVTGRTPNTTASYATNSQYIATGEIALNLTDGKMFSSNGTLYFEIGANLVNQYISNTITANNLIINSINCTSNSFFSSIYFTSLAHWKRALSANSMLNTINTYVENNYNQFDDVTIEWFNGSTVPINGIVYTMIQTATGYTNTQMTSLQTAAAALVS